MDETPRFDTAPSARGADEATLETQNGVRAASANAGSWVRLGRDEPDAHNTSTTPGDLRLWGAQRAIPATIVRCHRHAAAVRRIAPEGS